MPHRWASSTTSATGCTVPTSLFAHITLTSATSSPCAASSAASAARSSRPTPSTGSSTASAPCRSASQAAESRTAWCSTAETSTRRRRGSAADRAQNRPLTARLSDSVPPPVKTTSVGRAPSRAAHSSRDSSTTRRAARPASCTEDGLPTRPSSAVSASIASGCIGVVAAWSRYATCVAAPPRSELMVVESTNGPRRAAPSDGDHDLACHVARRHAIQDRGGLRQRVHTLDDRCQLAAVDQVLERNQVLGRGRDGEDPDGLPAEHRQQAPPGDPRQRPEHPAAVDTVEQQHPARREHPAQGAQ